MFIGGRNVIVIYGRLNQVAEIIRGDEVGTNKIIIYLSFLTIMLDILDVQGGGDGVKVFVLLGVRRIISDVRHVKEWSNDHVDEYEIYVEQHFVGVTLIANQYWMCLLLYYTFIYIIVNLYTYQRLYLLCYFI